MNNFTESLPKTGHVNEVCKEWLVREDSALAYKLQSQEINDFYKGNRFRNAVVREDFPTALNEQIKEQENAEKQAERYRRQLMEQEEHDKRVAREIAEKLDHDLQEQQERQMQESELIAQRMQEMYVNLPPVPPPASREKGRPPPRPAKASTLQQSHAPSTSSHGTRHQAQTQQRPPSSHHQEAAQSFGYHVRLDEEAGATGSPFSDTNGYVGVELVASNSSHHFLKLSPEKYDQLVGNNQLQQPLAGNAAERHMQAHADDIELYVDPCDYASLKEIGLPIEEIKEISKKLKQEQKDELLARRLQELEAHDGLSQEERDRMLAIEAQDKELAKMLQDRERAKAKRAKEKARLRKSQQREASGSLHCGPLMALPQDCMAGAKHCLSSPTSPPPKPSSARVQEGDPLELEPYSNPIDVLHGGHRPHNGTLTNGSLTREPAIQNTNRSAGSSHLQLRDDDIYTLPVDTCRGSTRPTSLSVGCESSQMTHSNSMTRSENYSLDSHDSLNGHDVPPMRLNYSKSGTFDQNASPTPPYMPIQGSRRSNSSEDRKKKSKDKCTHQ